MAAPGADPTTQVQWYIDAGLQIPAGNYEGLGVIKIPADYCARARRIGRGPDIPAWRGEGFRVAEEGTTLRFAAGWLAIPGSVVGDGDPEDGPIEIGRPDCAYYIPARAEFAGPSGEAWLITRSAMPTPPT